MKPRHLFLVAAGILLPQSAISAVLSYESFSGYTDATQLDAQTAPTVAGYTGNWVHASTSFGTQDILSSSTGLSYSGLSTTGGSAGVPVNPGGAEIEANDSGRVARQLDSTLNSGTGTGLTATNASAGTIYLSFLFQSGQQTGATTYHTLALYDGIGNTNSDASRNFDIGLTTNGGQTGSQYNFGADNTYTSTGVAADTAVHLFVVRFDLSATDLSDSVTIWVDPTLGGAGDPTGGTTVSGKNLTWDTLALSDYDGNSANWDEIRWGTDFQSVTVPEPSAALLGGLGMLALVRRRRN